MDRLQESVLQENQMGSEDVRQALRSRNRDTSGGDFWEGKRRYVVRTLGEFQSPEEVASLQISGESVTSMSSLVWTLPQSPHRSRFPSIALGSPVDARAGSVPGQVRMRIKKSGRSVSR